jgi:hypothetical protein
VGRIIGDQWDHEGYVLCVFADGFGGASYRGKFVFANYTPAGELVSMPGEDEHRRPESEVVAWRAACECGWLGHDWERVAARDVQDLDAHKMYADEALLSSDEEDQVLIEWREHAQSFTRISDVQAAFAVYEDARRRLDGAVIAARAGESPASWEAIGRVIGTSRQAAHERYGRLIALDARGN